MPPLRSRARSLVLAGLSAVLLAACSSAVTSHSTSAPQAGPPVPPLLGALHVAHLSGGLAEIVDAAGEEVTLRGVAAVGLEDIAYTGSGDGKPLYPIDPSAYDGRCPAVSALGSQGPLCEVEAAKPADEQSAAPGSDDDFAEMRSLGIDVVRLVVDWSELEPSPGVYSTEFLDRIAQVVGWAAAQGISVILDMHEDQYSRFILPGSGQLPPGCTPAGGYDGAPRWAVFTDDEPACQLYGESDLDPAVAAAFDNFWHNRRVPGPRRASPGPGLQDEYIGALAALARRFDPDPAVIGYELMNEPLPGDHSSLPLTNVVTFSDTELYPFYRRAIEALTGVRDGLATCPRSDPTGFVADGPPPYPAEGAPCAYPDLGVHTGKLLFFEPAAYRNLLDFSPQHVGRFSTYPNLVFAPHIYTHAFTLDSFVGLPLDQSTYPPSYTFGYQTATDEAEAMGTAVFVTEFGDNSGSDSQVLSNELAAQDRTGIGGTLWAWDGLSASKADCWCVLYQHSTYETSQDGLPGTGDPSAPLGPPELIASRVALLAQPLALAVDGEADAVVSGESPSGGDQAYALVADRPPGTADLPTLVEIPAAWSTASVRGIGATVSVSRLAGGARLARVTPSAIGRYEVVVAETSSAGVTAENTAIADAAVALAPISYATAIGDLNGFLVASEHSTTASVRSNAALVAALAEQVLGEPAPTSGGTTPVG